MPPPKPAALKQLLKDGYLVLPGVVPKTLLVEALREINHRLGRGRVQAMDAYADARDYWSEDSDAPAIQDLLFKTPLWSIANSFMAPGGLLKPSTGQIALRFPAVNQSHGGPAAHVDGFFSPNDADQRISRFTMLVGVLLSDVPAKHMGNLTVYPGTHRAIADHIAKIGTADLRGGLMGKIEMPPGVQLTGKAGDAVLLHYQLAHDKEQNLSHQIRYAAYWRLWHEDAESRQLEGLTDIWLEWPAVAALARRKPMDELTKRGIERFNAGRLEDAVRCFSEAAADEKCGPEPHVFLAHVLEAAARHDEARAQFEAAIGRFPGHSPAYAGLAALLLRRGTSPEGAAPLRGALELEAAPRERRPLLDALRLCAQAWRAAGDLDGAEAALKRALELSPSDRETRKRMRDLLQAREQLSLSRKTADEPRAPAPPPPDPELLRSQTLERRAAALRALSREQLAARDAAGAERSLREALLRDPCAEATRRLLAQLVSRGLPPADGAAETHRRAALMALAEGRLADAEAAVRLSLAQDPRSPEALILRPELELLRGRLSPPGGGDKPPSRRERLRQRALERMAEGELEEALRLMTRALSMGPRGAQPRLPLVPDLLRPKALQQRIEALRELGRRQLAAGDAAAAERTLREALVRAPGDAEARRLLAELVSRHLAPAPSAAEAHRRAALLALAAGRPGEAEAAARRALARDPRDPEARRLRLELELIRAPKTGPGARGRRRRLQDLLRRRALAKLADGELEAALRVMTRALALDPRGPEARLRLVDALAQTARRHLSAGQRRRAQAGARRILALDPREPRALLIRGEGLCIAGREREGRPLLSKALARDAGALTDSDRFRALMKLGRHEDALACGERILDRGPGLKDLRAFWDPWDWDERRPWSVRRAELAALERSVGEAASPWLQFYRGSLLGPRGLEHFQRLSEHSAERYGWMYFRAGFVALLAARFDRAAQWLELALRHEPVDWRARCFLAEAYLCLHDDRRALATMDRALADASPAEAPEVLAWRGAFDLWLGRYEEALDRLEAGCRQGAQCAFCWKGAALLKLGRLEEALAALDRTLELYPLDFEARTWRGEAKRRLGRPREALSDLERVPRGADLWALVNRALAKKALGDARGFSSDVRLLDEDLLGYVRARTGLTDEAELLEAALELSRGFRRSEYRQAVWMRPHE